MIQAVLARLRRIYPLLVVLGLEVTLVSYLVLSRRGTVGHDTFQYFTLQYYFLSNAIYSGETAQWMPLLTHGTVSNWWYGVQAGILQGAMLALRPLAGALKGANFLPIFYAGLLFDLTLFLLGIWLLGRRYFSSNRTILFVALAAVGSANWFTQPWYNVHLVFALPLIFHFIHQLLDTGKWRYLLFAGNLFAVQSIGIPSYVLPVSTLVVSSYTVFHVAFFWRTASAQLLVLIRRVRYAILPVIVVALSLGVVYGMLTHGTEEIANYNVGRTIEGKSESVASFLTYGSNSDSRWLEMLTRVSPVLDYSLYAGYLTVAFALLACTFTPRREYLVVASTTLVVLLIANATLLARLLYFVWPMMKYYRHLGLASPIVRTLLCFVAGFGFELLLTRKALDGDQMKLRLIAAITCMGTIALLAGQFALRPFHAVEKVWTSVMGGLLVHRSLFDFDHVQSEFVKATVFAAGAMLLFVLLFRTRRASGWIVMSILVFQAADIYSFRFDMAMQRTTALTPEQYALSELQPLPYAERRAPVDYATHPRARHVPQNRFPGSLYWTADTFMWTDPPANMGRTDHWLWAFDDFLRTFWGEALRDTTGKPFSYQRYLALRFPSHHPAALALAGVTEDKIQFFSAARFVADNKRLSAALRSSDGDRLYLSGQTSGRESRGTEGGRVRRRYEVLRYDANHLEVRVRGAAAGEWLYYADSWHPFWQAAVNGAPSRIFKANLGYKAVALQPGDNLVHLRFHSPFNWLCFEALNWNAALWVLGVLGLAWRELTKRSDSVYPDATAAEKRKAADLSAA